MLALLQFDSASLPLLQRMLDEGRLPTIAALRCRGRWETMDAQATFLQSSTYMTLCTGVDVREHGVYSAVPWCAGEQRARFMYDLQGPPTIWDRLTTCGRRALVIDPILAWPPRHMHGVYLSGWQFEDRMVSRGLSVPHDARRTLSRRHGRAPRLDDVYGTRRAASLLAWRDRLVQAPARVADAAIDLLRRDRFDFAWINFAAAHKAGHHLWDPSAVVGDTLGEADRSALAGGLAEVYEAVDRAMGRVLAALPEDADLIIFSPTGMAANTSRAELLPEMLDAVLAGQARPGGGAVRGNRSPIWTLRSTIPAEWRDRVARALPDSLVADVTTRWYMRRDWSKTRAVAVPGENKGYVRVNLAGRERNGVVRAAEVDALLNAITNGLLSFRESDDSPVIAKVERMSDIAGGGKSVSALPDLVVHWGERPPLRNGGVTSPMHGYVRRRGVGSGRSGNHVDDAWAILAPGVSRTRDIGRSARVTDIGATACGVLGADLSGLSGTPLFEGSA